MPHGYYNARAIPSSTPLERRRAFPCPKCGAAPHEKCRRWTSEKTSSTARYTGTDKRGWAAHVDPDPYIADGEGRWTYLKTLHAERKVIK